LSGDVGRIPARSNDKSEVVRRNAQRHRNRERCSDVPVDTSAESAPVDISPYGTGMQVTPGGRTARLEREADGRLVSRGHAAVTDDMMYALIDSVRR
jgi:hypothetical protein